eukprot:2401767-Pyramimonas_sp.AAC.1
MALFCVRVTSRPQLPLARHATPRSSLAQRDALFWDRAGAWRCSVPVNWVIPASGGLDRQNNDSNSRTGLGEGVQTSGSRLC